MGTASLNPQRSGPSLLHINPRSVQHRVSSAFSLPSSVLSTFVPDPAPGDMWTAMSATLRKLPLPDSLAPVQALRWRGEGIKGGVAFRVRSANSTVLSLPLTRFRDTVCV